MSGLLVYNPIYFTGLEHLDDFNTWRGMYCVTNAVTAPYIDRTSVVKFPIKTFIPESCLMPKFNPNFNMSYLDCALEEANVIYQDGQENELPICVFWSGGIDSSMVLTAFIMARGMDYARKNLKVVMTPESVIENPVMYYKFILPNLEIISGEHIDSMWDKDKIIVTGELNDQLIGSDVMRDFIAFKGTKETFTPWQESEIVRYYHQHKKMPEIHAEAWARVLSQCVRSSECPVNDYWDFYWYITFACKWMYVGHRLLVYADPSTISYQNYNDFEKYHRSFYASKNFQHWSMNNPDKKHQGSWQTHKWYPRKIVSDFMNESSYLNKNKNGSLWKLAISKFRANAIDKDLNMLENININDWYDPENSFKDI
jgi:hypothetical protein